LDYVPFDPTIKRTEATIRSSDGSSFRVTKGAPHVLLHLLQEGAAPQDQDLVRRVEADVHKVRRGREGQQRDKNEGPKSLAGEGLGEQGGREKRDIWGLEMRGLGVGRIGGRNRMMMVINTCLSSDTNVIIKIKIVVVVVIMIIIVIIMMVIIII
jgi:hypothetical protein